MWTARRAATLNSPCRTPGPANGPSCSCPGSRPTRRPSSPGDRSGSGSPSSRPRTSPGSASSRTRCWRERSLRANRGNGAAPPERSEGVTPPGLRRTRWSDLVAPLVVIAVTTYVLLRFSYRDLPQLQYFVAAPIAALAVAEVVAARRVRAAVRHDPNARPMAAIVIARCVALGKASSLVGAGVAGAALGMITRLLPDVRIVRAAGHDARVATLLLAASVFLVGAGLLLERAGVDPGRDRREN